MHCLLLIPSPDLLVPSDKSTAFLHGFTCFLTDLREWMGLVLEQTLAKSSEDLYADQQLANYLDNRRSRDAHTI